ncbi:hypothetical protein RhiXN_04621 [Rhizoctonia solani]|uniref:Uncharacterized protein n=1 Tax=Rhizoctonia solani TaxID=456999 RepID=A0A8H8NQ95_9AGAM|nr:uncharacterized protein RhiXN_04621 [Rhizoctonia solani]QRW16620.1 hypothetical protein RhiXN_04621 [Rhizoctonia solani]
MFSFGKRSPRTNPSPAGAKTWIPSRANPSQEFRAISFSKAQELNQYYLSQGYKLRFDWSALTETAYFKMPGPFHELPGLWLFGQCDLINQRLAELAICGIPKVYGLASSDVQLTKGSLVVSRETGKAKSYYQPDGSLYLEYYTTGNPGRPISAADSPRVVMEVCFSQSLEDALDKAVDYLHFSDRQIHAVIICDMKYNDPRKKLGFQANISLWMRPPTGNPDEDFPLDECQLGQADHAIEADTEDLAERAESIRSEGTEESVQPELHFSSYTKSGQAPLGIWNRSGWQIIIDETREAAEALPSNPQLTMSFYDVVRICNKAPSHALSVQEQMIPLPLQWLQARLVTQLEKDRQELKPAPVARSTTRSVPRIIGMTRRVSQQVSDAIRASMQG